VYDLTVKLKDSDVTEPPEPTQAILDNEQRMAARDRRTLRVISWIAIAATIAAAIAVNYVRHH
jgi:hypothetical protein